MRIRAWNVGPRPWRDILRSFRGLPADDARLTALFEASNPVLVNALRARYPNRRVICRSTDSVAMVSRKDPRPRVEVLSHDVPWRVHRRGGQVGKVKRGRRWLLLVLDDVAILLIHRVTPVGNESAWDAETQIIRATTQRKDLPRKLIIVGDHNGTDERLREVYASMGLKLLPADTNVDQCAVRGFDGRGVRIGNHGSDHVGMLWLLS